MTTLDLSSDLAAVVDGLEPVTIRRPGQNSTNSVPSALRRAVATAEAEASHGRYMASDVKWHLPADEMSEAVALGDQIIDGQGRRWTVLEIRIAGLSSRLEFTTRELALTAGLSETVKLQRATWVKGDAGAPAPVWSNIAGGVLARIQPQRGQVEVEHQARIVRITHKIYLAEPFDVDEDCRVIGPAGEVYDVVGYEKPERIDALAVIDAVERD